MYDGLLVIDADAHKVENPMIFRDYVDPAYRNRIGMIVDRLGDQRARVMDYNPVTGTTDLPRIFPKPEGFGKGGFRTLHPETTLGALFNSRRIEDMDQEGVDVHVIYGTFNLTFSSIFDKDLAVALCKAYNDYMAEDCRKWGDRLKPIGVVPLQDVDEAVKEMYRCVNELGMVGVATSPNIPIPHPAAPQCVPRSAHLQTYQPPGLLPPL